jgi:predicted ATPase
VGNRLISVDVNAVGGRLHGTLSFEEGLNILAGENGTLKTTLLQSVRTSPRIWSLGVDGVIQSISPKRNAERRNFSAIVAQFRQQNRTWDHHLAERLSATINNTGFDNYPAMADVFYLMFEDRSRDGGERTAHMTRVTEELNEVIQSIFPHYQIVSTWDHALGAPSIAMRKNDRDEFPIEHLSMGEQEVLSLVIGVWSARERTDVYLIDEPEVHLNWHLEDRLFQFFLDFCDRFDKQIIAATHSRTIFKPAFLSRTRFLRWMEGRIEWSATLTIEERAKLAGDVIEVISLGDFSKPTFFVEDNAHCDALETLAAVLGRSITVTKCGNSSNVISLFRYQKDAGGWPNSYFLIDGDNRGNPHQGELGFIHLPVYSIENCFLDPQSLAQATSIDEIKVKEMLVEIIQRQRVDIFRKNKFGEFLVDGLRPLDVTFERLASLDGSLVLPDFAIAVGLNKGELMDRVIRTVQSENRLDRLFPLTLIDALGADPARSARLSLINKPPTNADDREEELPSAITSADHNERRPTS